MLTLVLLSPLAVLGLLFAMAAFERRMLGQWSGRTSPPVRARARGTRRER